MRLLHKKPLSSFFISCLLSMQFACSITPPEPTVSPLDESIEKATRDIQISLKLLANTQNALASKTLTPAQIIQANATTNNVPPRMSETLTLHWEGPIEPAVKTAASAAGYEFRVTGQRSIPPIIVRLSADLKPIIQILEDIGLQTSAATVDIVTQSRVVYLRYGDKDAR